MQRVGLEENRMILGRSFRGFSPWLTGCKEGSSWWKVIANKAATSQKAGKTGGGKWREEKVKKGERRKAEHREEHNTLSRNAAPRPIFPPPESRCGHELSIAGLIVC